MISKTFWSQRKLYMLTTLFYGRNTCIIAGISAMYMMQIWRDLRPTATCKLKLAWSKTVYTVFSMSSKVEIKTSLWNIKNKSWAKRDFSLVRSNLRPEHFSLKSTWGTSRERFPADSTLLKGLLALPWE